jgi:hypothetical protein
MKNEIWRVGRIFFCNFCHVEREANKASHMLAFMAHLEPSKVWLEEAPPSPACTSFDHGLGPLIIFSFIKKNVTG